MGAHSVAALLPGHPLALPLVVVLLVVVHGHRARLVLNGLGGVRERRAAATIAAGA